MGTLGSYGEEPLRLIVVDDSRDILDAISETLEEEGFAVTRTTNGREALEALAGDPNIAAVVTDIVMPDVEGLELIAKIRTTRPGLPVIAMSGGGMNGSLTYLKLAQRLGAARTIEKPFEFADLVSMVRDVLATKSA